MQHKTAWKQVGCLALILLSGSAEAQRLYSWTDENGVTNYSSHPPAQQNGQVQTLKDNGDGPLSKQLDPAEQLLNPRSRHSEACAYYQSLFKRYQQKGVTAFNPQTGKAETLRGKAAAQAKQQAQEAIRLYCRE